MCHRDVDAFNPPALKEAASVNSSLSGTMFIVSKKAGISPESCPKKSDKSLNKSEEAHDAPGEKKNRWKVFHIPYQAIRAS